LTKSPRLARDGRPRREQSFPDLAIGVIGSLETAHLIVYHITRAANDLEDRRGRYLNGDDFSTAIWHTLSCGFGWEGRRRATSADRVHYDAFLVRHKDAMDEIQSQGGRAVPTILDGRIVRNEEEARQVLKGLQTQDIQRYLNKPDHDEPPQKDQEQASLDEKLFPFFNMVMNYQKGRRTCVTSNFYLGTVLAEAEEGDVIAMFFGLGVPLS
jgi:hypothetical protein